MGYGLVGTRASVTDPQLRFTRMFRAGGCENFVIVLLDDIKRKKVFSEMQFDSSPRESLCGSSTVAYLLHDFPEG